MGLRVGTLAYATNQGLGILAKSFHDHGVVTDALVVRHTRHVTHDEWYPGATFVNIRELRSHPTRDVIRGFCAAMDVMLFLETPFDWDLIPHCRGVETKTALMPMHECTPAKLPHQPDLFVCPSQLDFDCFVDHGRVPGEPGACVFLPVPVEVPWRQRERAEVFVHNAGHGGLRGRNGTAELIEASRLLKSNAKIVIHSQKPWVGGLPLFVPGIDERLHFMAEDRPWSEVWKDGGEGDVFVFPEKFNGLSLPLQEARAAGMLVMATDRFPMNTWLPRESLIPPFGNVTSRIGPAYREFEEAVVRPQDIAAKIDEWHGKDIRDLSLAGKYWAEEMSWDVLKPQYVKLLEDLCA